MSVFICTRPRPLSDTETNMTSYCTDMTSSVLLVCTCSVVFFFFFFFVLVFLLFCLLLVCCCSLSSSSLLLLLLSPPPLPSSSLSCFSSSLPHSPLRHRTHFSCAFFWHCVRQKLTERSQLANVVCSQRATISSAVVFVGFVLFRESVSE